MNKIKYVDEVRSGGQTGADFGGLRAAHSIGIKTGGWAPKGWRTEKGPNEFELRRFGLKECKDGYCYKDRTILNLNEADLTILFAEKKNSPGSVRTRNECFARQKYFKGISLKRDSNNVLEYDKDQDPLYLSHEIEKVYVNVGHNLIINIAGNRESVAPGIEDLVYYYLVKTFLLLRES